MVAGVMCAVEVAAPDVTVGVGGAPLAFALPKESPVFTGFGGRLIARGGAFLFVFAELPARVFVPAGVVTPLPCQFFCREASMLATLPGSDRRDSQRLRSGWLRRGAVKVWWRSVLSPTGMNMYFMMEPPAL